MVLKGHLKGTPIMPQGHSKDTTQERPKARCRPKDNFQGYSPRVNKHPECHGGLREYNLWFTKKGGRRHSTARPPTPRYTEPQRPEEQPQPEESTAQPMPQPHEEAVHQAQAEEQTVLRTEVPAAADGGMDVARGAHDGTDEGGAQDMGGGGPKVSPRDPRTRGRQDAWVPPTPSAGPPIPATTATTGEAESLEKGPWVWPEPPATQRPPLQRPRPQFMRQVSAPEEGGWREIARSEWPEGIEEAPAVATALRKGGRRCVLVSEGGRRYRPVISSDSDVELVENPRVEQRRWRLRKAVNRADGGIPTGAAEVEWASEEAPQDQLAPSSHAEAVVAAKWEFRRKCEARRRSEERRLKEMEESPEWQAQLRMAEEEEQQLWENPGYPPTPRYAPEPCIPPQEVADDWASSPPRWLPEIPLTPRYEGSPQWTQARPPTPRSKVATADGCLGGKWSPGEPAGSQDPWQTGAVGATDAEHRTHNAKDRAIDANVYRERDTNRGASGARTLGVA
ncbi:uncharacterized protein [Drosophila suzukii]|uniref:Uncharacterized protein n=1 Tax=Drosophila suzukii TaxID=28584 RepID=A0ABM4TNB3_DROSZ